MTNEELITLFASSTFGHHHGPNFCSICSFDYCPDYPCDVREHRNRHRQSMIVLRPKRDPKLALLHAKHGPFVTVRVTTCFRTWCKQ
jgi:hypothetical protein